MGHKIVVYSVRTSYDDESRGTSHMKWPFLQDLQQSTTKCAI